MTIISHAQVVVATFVVAASVAACAGSEAGPSRAIEGDAAPWLKAMTHVELGRDVGPVAVTDDAVVFPAGTRSGARSEVESVDFNGSGRRVVGRSRFGHGFINGVAASTDGWIYYVDQSAKQSESNPDVLWRVVAVDPGTRKSRTLASNGSVPDPYVPIIRSQNGWAFWTSAEADKTAREHVWKPGWDRPRDLLRHVEMTPGSESVNGGSLIYLGKAATNARGHTIGGDCWSVPLNGGTPTPLTHTALAMSCAASGAWVVWTQHIGPKDPVPADDGVLDDPYGLWAAHSGEAPRQLHRGYFSSTTPCADGPVVVWSNYPGRWIVQRIADPTSLVRVPGSNSIFPPVCNGRVVVMTSTTRKGIAADVLPLAGS